MENLLQFPGSQDGSFYGLNNHFQHKTKHMIWLVVEPPTIVVNILLIYG
jgi:hypothetical protein